MITLIDNLQLNDEERKWYEKILQLLPIATRVKQWIGLEEITDGINTYLGENETHIVVATGGVEVYSPRISSNVFVFTSPNFGHVNQPTPYLIYDECRRIIENPTKHHKAEIEKLQNFLSQYNRKVKIIEGDVGNSGLSIARLYAIYQSMPHGNQPEILIGAAPTRNIHSILKMRASVFGCDFHTEDLRGILGLGEIQPNVIFRCEDGYIRRASEIFGVSRHEDVENDVQKWEEFYKGMGILSKSRLKDYSKWFRKLTLKKVDRVTYVQQKIEKLRSLS